MNAPVGSTGPNMTVCSPQTLALMEQNQLFQEETRPRYATGKDVAQSH